MKRDPRLYVDDILQPVKAIEDYTRGVTEEEFGTNPMLQDAVVRRLEIIGEAARQLPKELKDQHPNIPWRRITGLRNRITHEYFGIILERVWAVTRRDLPALKTSILQIIEDLPQG